MAKFEFGQHEEMSESLSKPVFIAKSRVPSFTLTAYGNTQEEANEHLMQMFGKLVEAEYKSTKAT